MSRRSAKIRCHQQYQAHTVLLQWCFSRRNTCENTCEKQWNDSSYIMTRNIKTSEAGSYTTHQFHPVQQYFLHNHSHCFTWPLHGHVLQWLHLRQPLCGFFCVGFFNCFSLFGQYIHICTKTSMPTFFFNFLFLFGFFTISCDLQNRTAK